MTSRGDSMEDCNSETLLEWIAVSKKLKLSDTSILNNLVEMLENISKETRTRIIAAAKQQQEQEQPQK